MEKTKDQFYQLLEKISKRNKRGIPKNLLSIDPGETTGYAIFKGGKLEQTGEIYVKKCGLSIIYHEFKLLSLDYVLIEDYKIYPNKLRSHVFDEVFTVKVIGAIEYMFQLRNIQLRFQMASAAKGFVDNAKLRAWDMWKIGTPHARDAIRNGAYWLLFGKR